MADLKTLLKEARKLIDEKNYKEAQECCKNILRKDKQNYLGLVLLGKSLQESDQAPLAYQNAIASKPDVPLAWQGLANYYEKKDDTASKIKLLSIYDEMLKLQIDEEKTLEIISKISELGCFLKDCKAISIILNFMDKKPNAKIYVIAEKSLLELVKSDIMCEEEYIIKLMNCLKVIVSKDCNDSIYILLGKVILQKNNYVEAIEEVLQLCYFESSVVFREWLCKYLCTNFIKHESFCGLDVERYKDKIILGIENSKYPALLNSMICYNKGLYLDAYKKCVPLVNYQEADVTEATFIIKCSIMLKKWSVAQKLATNFLIKVRDNNFAMILKKFLFLSLAEQQKWKQAITVSKEIPIENFNVNELATLAKCYIEVNEQADHIMKNLQTTEYYLQLEALSLLKQKKYNEAIALLEKIMDTPLKLFYISKAYWELQEYDKSHLNLLKAAKLDSEHDETFLYLGMYYHHCKTDYAKAKKCYEKAYSLNNSDCNVIKHLSDVYIKLQLKDNNYDLLYKASQNAMLNQSWISFRLGLHYINRREWENAIIQFRNVIKSNHNDIVAFECLADAYFSRGSFTSALKAYNKVIKMNSNKIHCLTRIGYIHSILTQYKDAISTFKKVLETEPYSMLALKGIAETYMRIAMNKFNAKLYGSARDTAQNAIDYIIKALSKEKKFLCFWNLLGNALIFLTKLPKEFCFAWLKTDENMEVSRKENLDIYPQALACYSMIAKQKLQFTSYELASTYLDYYLASNNMMHCQISYQLTVACIKLKPSVWRNWNLLGRICIFRKKYALAQHCLIKALLVTRKWSVADVWCNLGTLYLKMNQHKLANYCFWRGQSTSPSYPLSWIGQGLIAEVIREEEAMDLFRHASRLGYHPESALGYADWVCRTIKHDDYKNSSELKYVIDSLDAIPYAMDLVMWFSTYEPNNACSCNILGILQERSGLLSAALESYQKALQYAEEDYQNIILLNIGRILLRLEKYDEAIKIYKAITEASLNSACGLAFGLFKKELYEEAYSAYDTALQWLSNTDDDKADLLVAMAGIVYMFKGMDDAKTLLFHSIQVSQKKPTANSLFAICSLGLIHADQSLSKLALSELQKYEKDSRYGYDIGFLKSYLVVDKDLNQAIKIMSDALHDHPDNTHLWFCLAQYCLNVTNTKANIASCCAQRALCSAYNCENKNFAITAKMIATASIAEHIVGDRKKAMLLAKGGLHMYPCQSDIWAALLFSVLNNKMWSTRTNWVLNRAGHMRKNLETTRVLSRWVNLLEKKLNKQLSS
ncbi:superkiller complex protein 3 [Vanessa tameamea]|uniref:Superkiller complex protein 3 n=1 Tax=Vanessa tameamea TaxID=334116 RepID=A0ABM4AK28_VANTA